MQVNGNPSLLQNMDWNVDDLLQVYFNIAIGEYCEE